MSQTSRFGDNPFAPMMALSKGLIHLDPNPEDAPTIHGVTFHGPDGPDFFLRIELTQRGVENAVAALEAADPQLSPRPAHRRR